MRLGSDSMRMLEVATGGASIIPVLDFRRRRMVLQWVARAGTWSPYEFPPALVHGIASISAAGPNVCLFGRDGRLLLQIGTVQYPLAAQSPRIICRRGWLLLGLRRRFLVRSSEGSVLYSRRYWRGQGRDFFRWLAQRVNDSAWLALSGRQWSEGVEAASLSRQ